MKLNKIDLTRIVAIGHDDEHLQLLLDRGNQIEYLEIPAPFEAYEGLQHLDEIIAAPESDCYPALPDNQPDIPMIPIHSTLAAAVGYDADRHLLQVEFQNGSTYQYENVDADTWDALLETESTGRFFNREIRGNFRSRRID